MTDPLSVASLLTSILSILGVLAVVVRLFTKTEVRLDVVDERAKETAQLSRFTADNFNGPARASHMELSGRVTALEAEIKGKATTEAVEGLRSEMRQSFRHLESVITRSRGEAE